MYTGVLSEEGHRTSVFSTDGDDPDPNPLPVWRTEKRGTLTPSYIRL